MNRRPTFQSRAGFSLIVLFSIALSACSIPAATQALMDEYNRTIPTCQGAADCDAKWNAARDWVERTPSYAIRVFSNDRIETFDANSTRTGPAIQVTKESLGADQARFLVNMDCFANYGCPPYWETKIDFNQAVNAARPR